MRKNWERFFDTFPELDFEGYKLRAFRKKDADDLYKCLCDPNVTELTSFELNSVDQITKLIKASNTKFRNKYGINWAIVDKKTDRVIGFYGLMWIDPYNSRTEVGFILAKEYWNRGITTKVLKRILELVFSELGINSVEATAMVGNNASARVLEKCGFKKEGTLRELRYCRGKYHDFWKFSLLQKEWLYNNN
jgi:ribosomal-protein-alanine N-acetyltransferase